MPSLLLFLFATTAVAQSHVDPIVSIPMSQEFLGHPAVRAYFADLLARGGYGRWPTEQAAFIVLDERDGYRCIAWPSRRQYHRTQFDAAIPNGTVAIVHTHPRESPLGSTGDQQLARRLGVPIFVLTPRNIDLVTADGKNVPVVKNEAWAALSASSSRRCSAPGSPASPPQAD